jgi:hypothetical protein
VFRALEAAILRQPLDGGIFVRARQSHRVDLIREADEDDLSAAIDADAIGLWDCVSPLRIGAGA